jgi:hypothetical protein
MATPSRKIWGEEKETITGSRKGLAQRGVARASSRSGGRPAPQAAGSRPVPQTMASLLATEPGAERHYPSLAAPALSSGGLRERRGGGVGEEGAVRVPRAGPPAFAVLVTSDPSSHSLSINFLSLS